MIACINPIVYRLRLDFQTTGRVGCNDYANGAVWTVLGSVFVHVDSKIPVIEALFFSPRQLLVQTPYSNHIPPSSDYSAESSNANMLEASTLLLGIRHPKVA